MITELLETPFRARLSSFSPKSKSKESLMARENLRAVGLEAIGCRVVSVVGTVLDCLSSPCFSCGYIKKAHHIQEKSTHSVRPRLSKGTKLRTDETHDQGLTIGIDKSLRQ